VAPLFYDFKNALGGKALELAWAAKAQDDIVRGQIEALETNDDKHALVQLTVDPDQELNLQEKEEEMAK
jgi:hypothetical protein